MNTRKFKSRGFLKTLEALCHARGGKCLRGGKINRTYIASQAGVKQPTVSRWISGETEQPDAVHVAALAKFFKISKSQMWGDEPIDTIDAISSPTPEDLAFWELYMARPEHVRHTLRDHGERLIREIELDYDTSSPKQ